MLLFIPGVGNRLLNLSDAFEDLPAYAIDPSLVQRSAAQEIAAIIFADNWLFGTGPGSFGSVIYEYSSQSGDLLIGPTRAQHNTYLEIASESGVVGLAGWVVLVGGIGVLAVRSVLRLTAAPEHGWWGTPTRALAAGLVAVVAGWSTASIFLHIEHFRPVLVMFALVGLVAVRVPAPDPAVAPEQAIARQRALRGLIAGGTAAVTIALALGLVATPLLLSLSEPLYRAKVVFTLLPAPNTYSAYGIDVRNRVPVLPAYAAMIQSGPAASDVRVDAEPEQGVITAVAEGATREEVEAAVDRVSAEAPSSMVRYRGDLQYRLVELTPREVTLQASYPMRAFAITGAVVAAELALIAAMVDRTRRGRSIVPARLTRRMRPPAVQQR
jgi:hypothetical protein